MSATHEHAPKQASDAVRRDRSDGPAISVVIPTYNRCDMLSAALESVLAQRGNTAYEVLVVDNNSTDRTADVIHSFALRTNVPLQYVKETRQGAAHARNAGLSSARGSIIAFVDDDGWVAADWVATVKQVLDENPDIEYVGGRVLPQWPGQPPAWLTRAHWSPLAILDHGDNPLCLSAKQPIVLLAANLAVRRVVFNRLGQFAADFQHVRDAVCGGTEDHELQLRIWAAGGRGLYVPEMLVTAVIQPERLTRKYHRQWHTEHGRLCSRLRVDETIGSSGELLPDRQDHLQLFGIPAWLYGECIHRAAGWLWAGLRRSQPAVLEQEMRVRYYVSYIRTRYSDTRTQRPHAPVVELMRFVRALLRDKVRIRLTQRRAKVRPVLAHPHAEPAVSCDNDRDVRS